MDSKKQTQREIKFRAWDGETMLFDYMIARPQWCNALGVLHNEAYAKENYKVKEWKLMQFTGLLDKNGKEIYEGDIVLDGELQGVLIWNSLKASFCICFEYGKEYPKWQNIRGNDQSVGNNGVQCHDIEVIGNIYENPELLK